ncbi:MAG: DUF2842 domain-containing protein [Alphaproteobacteria bacterium]|nr:DUF2842 domain-containing protein [Alphaproteobacteria bacterium]
MRKILGSSVLLIWIVGYIAVAAVIGDRVSSEHWVWKLIYFPVAGLAWILPVRPLLRWMHARDAPAERPDV